LFVLILLVCRVLFLVAGLDPGEERALTALDPVRSSAPSRPERPLYDLEELYAGSAAEAMLMGAGLPLANYRVAPYGSGSLLVPLAAVPFYAAFGPHYLVFKILPLLVTILGGLAWFLVVRAWRGRRVAAIFAGLYILAPSMFVRTTLIAKGDHAEAMAWIGGILFLMTCAAQAASPNRKRLFAAGAGLAVGIGPFVTYSTVPIPAAVIVVLLIRTRLRPRDAWVCAFAAFLVGLTPWLASIASTHGATLRVYDRPIGSFLPPSEMLERVRYLVTRGLAAGYDLPGPEGVRRGAALLWLASVIVGAGIVLRRDRSTATLAALGAVAVGLGVYCIASPDSSSRYLVPAYPLLLATVAAMSHRPGGAGLRRAASIHRPSVIPAVCVMFLGLVAQACVVFTSHYPALHAPIKGTCWRIFGEYVGQLASVDRIRNAPRSLRPVLWVGCGKRTYWEVVRGDWPEVAAMAGPDSLRVWEGIGIGWVESGEVQGAGAVLPQFPTAEREAIRFGMAKRMEIPFSQLAVAAPDMLPKFLDQFQSDDRAAVSAVLPFVLASLTAQEALPAKTADKLAASLLSEDDRAKGIGWSRFQGVDREGSARFSPSPPERWTAAGLGSYRERSAAFFEGCANAWEWDLAARERVGSSGGGDIAEELALMTDGLDSAQASPFYRAVGRAMAAAAREPRRGSVGSSQLPPLGDFPEIHRPDVLSGWQGPEVPWASR
jgi:hypothetical protein